MISFKGKPALKAADVEAALALCAVNTVVSILAYPRHAFIHILMESLLAAWYGFEYVIETLVSLPRKHAVLCK